MKIKIFILNLFLLVFAGENFAEAYNSGILSAGAYHSCVIDNDDLKCWGSNNYGGQIDVPDLKNPISVSVGDYNTCALDEEGVKCWGYNTHGEGNVPTFKNPSAVSTGSRYSCAIYEEGVKCWGWDYQGPQFIPPLKNPTAISAGRHHTCAIDDEGVKCWGANFSGAQNVPPLKNPIAVSAGGEHSCAIDEEGVKCWGGNLVGETDVPRLKNPTSISAGGFHTCAIDGNRVKCWGENGNGQTTVPPLINPIFISAGNWHTCAIDDEGVKCWGSNYDGQTNAPLLENQSAPILNLSKLENFLDSLANWSTPVRTSFFNSLKSFARDNLKLVVTALVPEQILHGQYIFATLLGTSIETGDAIYYTKKIIPAFQNNLKKISRKTNIQNLAQVKDFPITRLTALKVMQSSLSVMTEFLTAENKAHIQDIIKLIGLAMTDVSNKQLITNALTAIDTNEAIINKLTQSSKTHFLVLTLKTAQQWLNTKIK